MNVAHTDCLRTANEIGQHVVHDLCTDAPIELQWDTVNRLCALSSSGICIVGIIGFACMSVMMVSVDRCEVHAILLLAAGTLAIASGQLAVFLFGMETLSLILLASGILLVALCPKAANGQRILPRPCPGAGRDGIVEILQSAAAAHR